MPTDKQKAIENTLMKMDYFNLLPVHREIIFLLKDGNTYKEVAAIMINRLGITTVGNHVKKIYQLINLKAFAPIGDIHTHAGIYDRLEMFNQ